MPALLANQLRALNRVFRPPFDGMWLAVLFYFVWCFLVSPKSQILRGNLPDPDDYMYIDQVLDWMKGQSWFDLIQHRLDPPFGGLIHFSRLAQLPMALLIGVFEALGLAPLGAATVMAVVEPLLLYAGFFFALRWVCESFVAKNWSGASAYVSLFATGLLAMFAPGHVDHHGLVVLLVTVALGAMLRMLREPESLGFAALAGVMLALSLVIALEVLPWLIMSAGWLGLWAVVQGRAAARGGLAFGLSLYIASAVLLLATRPPGDLLTIDMAAYSIVYVFFTGSIAAIFAGIALGGNKAAGWRWSAAVVLSLSTGGLFLHNFPELVTGPWGSVNPALAELILDNVNEAKPLTLLKGSCLRTVISVLEPLTASAAALAFLWSARGEERWRWGLISLLVTSALTLSVFYQYRFVGILGAFVSVPLTALLFRGWQWIGHRFQERPRVLAEIALLLLVGPLPAVLVPSLFDGRSFNRGVLLFPVHADESSVCDMYGLEKVLQSPELYGGRPRVIMNTMGLGPELLFRTPHKILAAPYHEVVDGNLDTVRFFSDTDTDRAEAVARRWKAELVVACKLIPGLYTDLAAVRQALPDLALKNKKTAAFAEPPMILRIISGQQLPLWLVPVKSPLLSNYVVYEIVPAKARR